MIERLGLLVLAASAVVGAYEVVVRYGFVTVVVWLFRTGAKVSVGSCVLVILGLGLWAVRDYIRNKTETSMFDGTES